jgi:hypothetical protein
MTPREAAARKQIRTHCFNMTAEQIEREIEATRVRPCRDPSLRIRFLTECLDELRNSCRTR